MRAFTAGDVAQGATGVPGAAADVTVALGQPAAEGNAALIVMGALTDLEPPEQFDSVATAGLFVGGRLLQIMVRSCLLSGEQSWSFSASSGTPFWVWRVEEWRNVSYAAPITAAETDNSTPGLSSIAVGPTGAWDAGELVVGIAAVLMLGNTSGAAWPSASFSDGFTVTHVIDEGTGAQADDLRLWIARRYGAAAAADTGPWETTATFTGTVTGKTPIGALAVFRAEHHAGDA